MERKEARPLVHIQGLKKGWIYGVVKHPVADCWLVGSEMVREDFLEFNLKTRRKY